MLHRLLFIPLTLLTCTVLYAQDCSYCKTKPRITQYDLDVQVQKPADTGKAWLQWRQLFWFSKFAQSEIYELNKKCVHFIQPLNVNEQGNAVLVVGETNPILPKGNNVSKTTDYLITGFIRKTGNGYIMHLELQAACDGKRVAYADVPFQPTTDPQYTMQIAQQAAMQLSPLADKINEFAKKERESNKKVAYSNRDAASVTITPKKRQLVTGEETEIEITLKDCDGYALSNREIVFTKGTISGMAINGTTGGTVTPSTVTTDANGKAKAKFKMGNGKTAMIYAHHVFEKPTGCSNAMTGSCPIGSIPVKVEIEYDTDQTQEFKPSFSLGAVKMEGGEDYSTFVRFYRAVFYHYPTDAKKGELVNVYIPAEDKRKTLYESEQGYFAYMHKMNETTLELDFAGMHHEELVRKDSFILNSGTTRPSPSAQVYFSTGDEREPMRFYLSFVFRNEEEEHETGTGGYPGAISIYKGDKGVKMTTSKINDPKSPYKTEYIIECSRDAYDPEEVDKLLGTTFSNMKGFKHTGKESLRVRILSPY